MYPWTWPHRRPLYCCDGGDTGDFFGIFSCTDRKMGDDAPASDGLVAT